MFSTGFFGRIAESSYGLMMVPIHSGPPKCYTSLMMLCGMSVGQSLATFSLCQEAITRLVHSCIVAPWMCRLLMKQEILSAKWISEIKIKSKCGGVSLLMSIQLTCLSKLQIKYYICICTLQVSLWKETLEGQWVCVSDVNKGQGQIKDSHQSEMIMS